MTRVHPADIPRGRAFLRAVCENPADDVVREVYADWLDEELGFAGAAEYIRMAVRHHRDAPGREPDPRLRQLLNDNLRHLLFPVAALALRPCEPGGTILDWQFSRGFVYLARLSGTELERYAAAVFSHHPVTEVRLRRGLDGHDPWVVRELFDASLTVRGEKSRRVPGCVFPYLAKVGYPCTLRGAVARFDPAVRYQDVISRAAVSFGRDRAGLTPMVWPAPERGDIP
jgi:uncharacterized protein (TIGR02996 family)